MPYSTIDDLPDFDIEFEDTYMDEYEDDSHDPFEDCYILEPDDERDDPYNDFDAPVYWLH